MALVSNTQNAAVTWSATAGTVNSSGLFTAPTASSPTSVTVTATSLADTSKSSSATLTVNPAPSVLAVSPASLSFSGQVAHPIPRRQREHHEHRVWILTFTGVSDQPWLVLSAGSGTAPSTLQVSPSISGMKAGTYTGHVTLMGGGVTKSVTVALTVTAPPVLHSVSLSWKVTTVSTAVKYNMYRSTISGGYYALLSNAIAGVTYSDQSVQPTTTYYYVVAAVDSQGRESGRSNEIGAVVP